MTIQSSREFAALARVTPVGIGRQRVAPRSANPVVNYVAGERIFEQGERAGKIFMVKSGVVRFYHLLADGRRQISAFYMPGEVFGFAQKDTHEFFAEAVEDTSVSVHDAQEALTEESVEAVLASLFSAQRHLFVLGRQLAGERLASFLIDLDKRQGGLLRVELSMTRSDIADYLGLTVETVSRGLSRLAKGGLIRLHSARSIEITKPQVLLDMVE
jgi:CRP/FNR family transcriptional regulator, nitrogen fixation regulation protein